MIKVHLHGILNVFGKPIELSVGTAREASEAVLAHLRRTNPELFERTLFFQILDIDTLDALEAPLTVKELHFMPAFNVGKKAGLFQVVLGAVLVVGAFAIGGPLGSSVVAQALLSAGVGLAVGGILQLVTPVPRIDTSPEDTNPEASKYISGTGNTTKVGTRIPLAWGTFPIFGHFLSINIQSRDIASGAYEGTPAFPYTNNYRFGYPVGASINVF